MDRTGEDRLVRMLGRTSKETQQGCVDRLWGLNSYDMLFRLQHSFVAPSCDDTVFRLFGTEMAWNCRTRGISLGESRARRYGSGRYSYGLE